MTAWWVTGSTLDVLRKIPDASIDLVLSSPPFFALRSYLDPDDPNKGDEIGSEATPGEFIDTLLDVTEECLRVLAPHGTLAFELGDTYGGSGGAGGDYNTDGLRAGQEKFSGTAKRSNSVGGRRSRAEDEALGVLAHRGRPGPKGRDRMTGHPLDKSLCLIPELYRISLVYGFNPLTGRECTRWRVRNVVRWVRPNPPVGALGDKFRPATSEMVIACQARTRYFDLDAVREPHKAHGGETEGGISALDGGTKMGKRFAGRVENPAGAPPLDWWEIPTAPYKGSHYATWPPALCERPIKAMSPERLCTTCGEPSRRTVSAADDDETNEDYLAARAAARSSERLGMGSTGRQHVEPRRVMPTGDWTDCGHDTWRPGRILDPFAGSGTTLAVATGHGRDAIGIDLDHRNLDLARQRVGMFLSEATVDELVCLLESGRVCYTQT